MTRSPETTITQSWTTNADAWTQAVHSGSIDSRERVTNAAIVKAVLDCQPTRVLDLGCGEGWLVRTLVAEGVEALGIDGSPGLIDAAKASGTGEFRLCAYDQLVERPEQIGSAFDVIVANFALLQEDLAPLLRSIAPLLSPKGTLIIQTVHPGSVDNPGQEGWRTEDFRSFEGHWQPMPWYYRTREAWQDLLRASGYQLESVDEPVHPDSQKRLSLIFTATANA